MQHNAHMRPVPDHRPGLHGAAERMGVVMIKYRKNGDVYRDGQLLGKIERLEKYAHNRTFFRFTFNSSHVAPIPDPMLAPYLNELRIRIAMLK